MPATPKQVAVIGAGPSGLAAASYLCAEGCEVTIFEQKSCPGGLWNAETDTQKRRWEKPVYDSLETNVPRQLTTFSDKPWPADTPLFPPHSQVLAYLRSYAQELKQKHGFNFTVLCNRQASRIKKETRKGYNSPVWAVDYGHLDLARNTRTSTRYFHAIVMSTGTYQRAFIPDYEGLEEWAMVDQKSHVHSLHYSDTQLESYSGQNVLIIGYGPSGFDISQQIAKHAKFVAVSTRSPQRFLANGVSVNFPAIQKFNSSNRSVTFEGGAVFSNIDRFIWCTGYSYSLDFILGKDDRPLFPPGNQVNHLGSQIFYVEDPTLAFVGLPKKGATFIIAEAQSAIIARIFGPHAGIIITSLIDEGREVQDICAEEWRNRVKEGKAAPDSYHDLVYPADKTYVQQIWASYPNNQQGKVPPFWCTCMDRARAQAAELRLKYKALEEGEKWKYTTFESLGGSLPARCEMHERRSRELACCYLADEDGG